MYVIKTHHVCMYVTKTHHVCMYVTETDTPCTSAPCQNGATCTLGLTAATYVCDCAPGYTGDICDKGGTPCVQL